MNKDFTAKVEEFIESTWNKDIKCPLCGSKYWNISSRIFEMKEFHKSEDTVYIVYKEPIKKLVIPISCGNCGNTIFIDPITTGLLNEYEK